MVWGYILQTWSFLFSIITFFTHSHCIVRYCFKTRLSTRCGNPSYINNFTTWQANNLVPLKLILLKHFWPRTRLTNILRAHAQTAGNFEGTSFTCGNLNILVSYFQLFQWRLSALYRLAPQAATQLAWP